MAIDAEYRDMGTWRFRMNWQVLGIAAAAIVFLWFVWPTPYEYTKSAHEIYRVNRWTGVKEIATGQGWASEKPVPVDLSQYTRTRP